MMMLIVLSFLLPIICEAEITINITVASNKDDTLIQFFGADIKLITDAEINLFNVTIPNLNYGARVELGRVPNNIFLKDPTPYGNLFHKYKWPEVHRNLQVEKVKVLEVITDEEVLTAHEDINDSTTDVEKDRSLFKNVLNSANSMWSKSGLPEDNTTYNVVINLENGMYQFKNKWRSNELTTFFTKFGKRDNRTLTLKAGKGIIKKLRALSTTIVIQVEYRAVLIGNIVADYESLYGKYHFYSPTVNNIMRAGNIINEIRTRETMSIRCFTDPKVDVYDRDSGAPMHKRIRLFWKTNIDKYFRS